MSNEQPRAFTEEEVRDMFLEYVRHVARQWANMPDKTPLERCEGTAFSILNIFDGTTDLPAFDISCHPHPSDKDFRIKEGENYFEPGMIFQ